MSPSVCCVRTRHRIYNKYIRQVVVLLLGGGGITSRIRRVMPRRSRLGAIAHLALEGLLTVYGRPVVTTDGRTTPGDACATFDFVW